MWNSKVKYIWLITIVVFCVTTQVLGLLTLKYSFKTKMFTKSIFLRFYSFVVFGVFVTLYYIHLMEILHLISTSTSDLNTSLGQKFQSSVQFILHFIEYALIILLYLTTNILCFLFRESKISLLRDIFNNLSYQSQDGRTRTKSHGNNIHLLKLIIAKLVFDVITLAVISYHVFGSRRTSIIGEHFSTFSMIFLQLPKFILIVITNDYYLILLIIMNLFKTINYKLECINLNDVLHKNKKKYYYDDNNNKLKNNLHINLNQIHINLSQKLKLSDDFDRNSLFYDKIIDLIENYNKLMSISLLVIIGYGFINFIIQVIIIINIHPHIFIYLSI